MSIFNKDKTYNLELNKKESSVIYAFLTVNSYDRLYDTYREYKKNVEDEDIKRKGSREQLHYRDSLNRMKEEDRIVDIIMMNQLALGLLLEHYVRCCAGQKENETKIFKLNSILIYELYVTICERIIAESKDYNAKKSGQEIVKQDELESIIFRVNVLKNINKKLFKIIGLKDLDVMENEYKKISVEDHLSYCLQEF